MENGEARPTDAAFVVFEELSAQLDGHLADLDRSLGVELAALNELLAARQIEPIEGR